MKTEKKLLMCNRTLLKVVWLYLVFLGFLSPVYAAMPVVTPNEGTTGTTLTISGEGLGVKRGTVFIGSKPCQVLAWGNAEIKCLINVPMPPGEYDVILNPQGKVPRVILPKAFTIVAPKLDTPSYRPHFFSPGDVVTISGGFFGDASGRHSVEIENLQGDKRPCHILNWAMDSITFKLPNGIPGIFHLHVTNAVGTDTHPWWGTFTQPPEAPPNMVGSYTGMTSGNNASAVAYNGKLYAFYPHTDEDNYKIAYRIYDGIDWSDGYYLKTVEGVYQKSKAQINPLVADDILYVFYTGTDGNLYYNKWDFVADDDKIVPDPSEDPPTKVDQVWLPQQTIPEAKVTDVSGRFAAVYNFTKKWIEIYWTPDSINVYMKIYRLDTRTWSNSSTVMIPRPYRTYIAPYLTAVFNQIEENDYVTYLSWSDRDYAGYVAELKDGVVLNYCASTSWHPESTNRGPSLADLGDDYLAVITNTNGEQSSYQRYDKNAHTAVGTGGTIRVPFTSPQDTSWAPTGITFSTEVADIKSPTGFRMDSNFYVFVGNNPVAADTKWEFVKCEMLGYWMPTTADGDELDFGNSNMLADTFDLWPIIAVIDMPPYVENGHECTLAEWEKCGTEIEYSFKKVTTTGMSIEGSAGAYVRSRCKSPVEFDVSGGYTGGREDSQTITYILTDTLDAGREGTIMVYYYAPKFTVWMLEWYDWSGKPTGLLTETVKVTGAEVRKSAFNPADGPPMWQQYWAAQYPNEPRPPYLDPEVFPYHETELDVNNNPVPDADKKRLLTYCKDLTSFETVASSPCTWDPESPCGFTWGIDKDHSTDNGFYVDFKLGAKGPVVAGVEGSFKLQIKTKTETGVEAATNIKGPTEYDKTNPNRIKEFHLDGYWLRPNNNGYWVPEYRKTMGDKPWFITYQVTDGWLNDGSSFFPYCP